MILHADLSEGVIGAAIEVHRALGPGLLESAYCVCLQHELGLRGIRFEKEVALPVLYKGVRLDYGYRLDLVIEGKIIVECKAVQELIDIHEAQLLTYLRLSGIRVGLLINFNGAVLRNNIIRRVV